MTNSDAPSSSCAEGFSADHREYVVIRKTDPSAPKAFRLAEIVRRHPKLHAVRGYLQHYRSGRTSFVRAHTRGKGTHLQVKDYELP